MPVLAYFSDYDSSKEDCTASVSLQATAGYFDSDYVTNSMWMNNTADYLVIDVSAQTDVWLKWHGRNASTSNNGPNANFVLFGDGVTWGWRLNCYTASSVRLEQYNGSGWDVKSGNWAMPASLDELVVHVKVDGTNGRFEMFQNGLIKLIFTGDTIGSTGLTDITQIKLGAINNLANSVSEVVVADQRPFECRVLGRYATSNGAATDWTGDYTDIDANDANLIAPTAANDISTFSGRNLPVGFPPEIVKCKVTANARTDDVAVGNDISLVCRSNSVNYEGSGIDLTAAETRYVADFDTDPNTATTWTEAGLNASEFGVKAL